jgi:hypothetical protein
MNLMGDFHVMARAVCHNADAGQVAVMVEHQMQPDRALGHAERRSVINGEAQVNYGRVEPDQLIFETKYPAVKEVMDLA